MRGSEFVGEHNIARTETHPLRIRARYVRREEACAWSEELTPAA